MFDKNEKIIPVTVIEAGPCFVTQIKDNSAVQIGFKRLKKIKKSLKNKPYRYLKEFKCNDCKFKIGDEIKVDIFKENDKIKVSSISKGKGFQGVIKRHKFSGGPASHGHRHVLRRGGSIGSAFPQRVMKGKKMPGHMGTKRVTVKNLKIVLVDSKNDLLAIKGAVPGFNTGLVEIKSI